MPIARYARVSTLDQHPEIQLHASGSMPRPVGSRPRNTSLPGSPARKTAGGPRPAPGRCPQGGTERTAVD